MAIFNVKNPFVFNPTPKPATPAPAPAQSKPVTPTSLAQQYQNLNASRLASYNKGTTAQQAYAATSGSFSGGSPSYSGSGNASQDAAAAQAAIAQQQTVVKPAPQPVSKPVNVFQQGLSGAGSFVSNVLQAPAVDVHATKPALQRKATSNPNREKIPTSEKGRPSEKAGKMFNVNERYIRDVKKLEKDGKQDKLESIRMGKTTLVEIKKEARLEKIKTQRANIEKNVLEKPEGKFDVIVIDPPWEGILACWWGGNSFLPDC